MPAWLETRTKSMMTGLKKTKRMTAISRDAVVARAASCAAFFSFFNFSFSFFKGAGGARR
jgi:hypothetical protein